MSETSHTTGESIDLVATLRADADEWNEADPATAILERDAANEIERLRKALWKIGYLPFGGSMASDRFVIDSMTECAREALSETDVTP